MTPVLATPASVEVAARPISTWPVGAMHWGETYPAWKARYCILNGITPKQFDEHFGQSYLSALELSELTGEPLEKCESVSEPPLDANHFGWLPLRFLENLQVCVQCVSAGFHGYVHQYVDIPRCPMHSAVLTTEFSPYSRGEMAWTELLYGLWKPRPKNAFGTRTIDFIASPSTVPKFPLGQMIRDVARAINGYFAPTASTDPYPRPRVVFGRSLASEMARVVELAVPGRPWPSLMSATEPQKPLRVQVASSDRPEIRRLMQTWGRGVRQARESLRILRIQHSGEIPAWRVGAQRLFTRLIDGHEECAMQFSKALTRMIPRVREELGGTPAWFAYQAGLCICHRLVLIDTLAKIVSIEDIQADIRWLKSGQPWPESDMTNADTGEVLPLLEAPHPFITEWSNPRQHRPGFRLVRSQSETEARVVDAVLRIEMFALGRTLFETERVLHARYVQGLEPERVTTGIYRSFAPVFNLESHREGIEVYGTLPARCPSDLPPAPKAHDEAFLDRFRASLEAMDRVTGLPYEWRVSVFAEAAENHGGLTANRPNPETLPGMFRRTRGPGDVDVSFW